MTTTRAPVEGCLRIGIDSEVGQLREVIVHRPGSELDRLTPANAAALLFDDVMWAERARNEHDGFEALHEHCVRVHHFGTLLPRPWPRRPDATSRSGASAPTKGSDLRWPATSGCCSPTQNRRCWPSS